MKDLDFRDLELRIRLASDSAGISRIDFEDGLVIYSALFTFALGKQGLRVYDLGAAMGYSSLWLAKAMEDGCGSGCQLTAVEVRPERLQGARGLLGQAGFERVRLEFVEGDALKVIEAIDDESIDAAFVDVEVRLYPAVLDLLMRKLRKGGLLMLHNAVRPPPPAETFQALVRAGWRYSIVPTLEGVLITRKP